MTRLLQALLLFLGIIAVGFMAVGCKRLSKAPEETFLGQPVPGDTAVLFAPEILTEELGAHGRLSFSPDGRELWWSTHQKIYFATFDGRQLSAPHLAPFNDTLRQDGPVFSHDGHRLYFCSFRQLPGEVGEPYGRVWTVERTAEGWGEPALAKGEISKSNVSSQISVTANGNLYVTLLKDRERIPACSKPIGGVYGQPEPLRFADTNQLRINDLYVDPLERFLLGAVQPDEGGPTSVDIAISFRQDDGTWGKLRFLNEKVNTDRLDRFPSVSPDGKYLFFARSAEVQRFIGVRYYWIATEALDIPGFPPTER